MIENKKYALFASLTLQEIYQKLATTEQGLEQKEAEKRYATYGPNIIPEETITWFKLLVNQLLNPFIYLLGAIAFIYAITHQITESSIIFIIIIVNSVIGFYQEYHSNQAMILLRKYLTTTTQVKRSGTIITIDAQKLVPGDIIILNAGDIIPADCRFIAAQHLTVDEAHLTGESAPVQKNSDTCASSSTLYNTPNIGFSGTIIIDGHAQAIVFATGVDTTMGTIALLTTQTISKSNLAQGTLQLARIVLFLVLVSLCTIFIITMLNPHANHSLLNLTLFCAALAITAIPTALPIVITFCLTQGAMALHKHKIIVKKLSVIEDLGSLDIFCTDKTGTLTENSLSVKTVYADNEQNAIIAAALTPDAAHHETTETNKTFESAAWHYLTSEQKTILDAHIIHASLPFTYERHRSIILAQKDNDYFLTTKGSAEYVIKQCPSLSQQQIVKFNSWTKNSEMQSNRVIAIATKKLTIDDKNKNIQDLDHDYETYALISFCDPLKTTAADAIQKARALQVTIKILSGDSAYVCYTIAQQLNLENDFNNVVTGDTFAAADENEKLFLAQNRTIFARVTPEQKYMIIDYLQRTNCVGYLGDGINDAPALKRAHVGIAVNNASAVAQNAAEIILLQKNLLPIINGIEEGRKTVINTLKYIKVTIASNIGNFYSLAISSLMINYLPMLPLQLLFLDLVTDLPLISISTDAVSKQELQKPLHYDRYDISTVVFVFGLVSLPFNFIIFALFKTQPAMLQTSWFLTCALMQLVLIFSLRTKLLFWRAKRPSIPLIMLCLLSACTVIALPFSAIGHQIFLFEQPTAYSITVICIIIIAYFVAAEIIKFFYYKTYHKEQH